MSIEAGESPFAARFVFEKWCARQESNLLPIVPQTIALSGEIRARAESLIRDVEC